MNVFRGIVIGAAITAATVALAAPASAVVNEGMYRATVLDGGGFLPNGAAEPAKITSCGPDCWTLMISAGPSDMRPNGPIWTGAYDVEGVGTCSRTMDVNSLVVTASCPSFGMNVSWSLAPS